jgi:hypothetical protein
MNDALLDQLARENPVPRELPMLPIEPVLDRLDEQPPATDDVHAPRDRLDGIALPRRARLRLPRGGTVTAVASMVVTLVVAGLAIVFLHHGRRPCRTMLRRRGRFRRQTRSRRCARSW